MNDTGGEKDSVRPNGGKVSRAEKDVSVLKAEEKGSPAKKRVKRKKKDISSEKLEPLKVAAERIAELLCGLSGDEELFVISADEKQTRRIDTKTLKEFSSVIKEITGVICELNGITPSGSTEGNASVKIEFEGDAEECSL